MTLLLLIVGFICLVVLLAAVAALIGWHPHAHDEPEPEGVDPATVLDWCEGYLDEDGWVVKCLNTPTHEYAEIGRAHV